MAKVIMIQGTMSSVGKSLITAGLCRIFRNDGYRVAPFKSQNMALNSYITEDGCEIGRAQAVQAQACGIKPSVFMNPILLKPTTQMGSQVIVNGHPIGNMSAVEYFAYKKKLIPDICAAYEKLSSENDIIVVEGAGSPAEINLKADDIVNMGLAKIIDAPVLLVGDIDRGGVFAQLYGTIKLLDESEAARIKGIIINKFRGDLEILKPGIKMLEDKCLRRVLGVVPYKKLDIEEEDSLSERFFDNKKSNYNLDCTDILDASGAKIKADDGNCANNANNINKKRADCVKVAVIKLPKMSNYTDFAPLEAASKTELSYYTNPQRLLEDECDMVIIPGTKNTIEDMKWLRRSGMESAILKLKEKNVLIMGICGGYQILGRGIDDAAGCEGGGRIRGMGLLDVETVFSGDKYTHQSEGIYNAPCGPMRLNGYEIHMGLCTYKEGAKPFIIKTDGKADGCVNENVIGTYFHGIFENDEFRSYILNKANSSIPASCGCSYADYRENGFEELARLLRENIDMEAVYDIIQNA